MNAQYAIDSFFAATLYSQLPSWFLYMNQDFFLVRFIDTSERIAWRWSVQCILAFLYFWIYQLSGIRNRYVIWHMERNNLFSGFHPIEILFVSLYFSVFLCIPTEFALLWFSNTNRFLTTDVWIHQLGARINLLFLIGSAYHIFLEKIGLNPFLRVRYFQHEFLR